MLELFGAPSDRGTLLSAPLQWLKATLSFRKWSIWQETATSDAGIYFLEDMLAEVEPETTVAEFQRWNPKRDSQKLQSTKLARKIAYALSLEPERCRARAGKAQRN